MTAVDGHGNPINGTSEAIAAYDMAIDRLVRFRPEVVRSTGRLLRNHPELAMGHALSAYLLLISTDPRDLPDIVEQQRAMDDLTLVPREAAHAAAVAAWASGDWVRAAQILDDVLLQWPGDLLALAIGHQLDFFLGDAANLRDRPARSLDAFAPDDPHRGIVLGMTAFGLEEAGDYGLSEAAGLAAVDLNPDDVWATHAVVHTYEMQGRAEDGRSFLDSGRSVWRSGNLFAVHNWWHYALLCLEQGDVETVLASFDDDIFHRGETVAPLELLDASALLWRLQLDGVDTGGRFGDVADAWAAFLGTDPWYVFNDYHAVIAFAGAGRIADVDAVVDRLTALVEAPDGATDGGWNRQVTRDIGLPVCQAIRAFALGRHAETVERLWPIRRRLHLAGGSHAQRDVIQRTLVDACLRSGNTSRARALIAERLNVRPASAYSRARRALLSSARAS